MATGPKLPETPLDLLHNDGTRVAPFLSQIWGPFAGGIVGFTCAIAGNWGTRRPIFSGIQRHVIGTGIGILIGNYLEKKRKEYYADREAVFRHYIELHPDDFPPYERKKIADIFEPWMPIR